MRRSQAKFEGCADPNSARRWCSTTRCLFSVLMSPPPRNSCLGGVRRVRTPRTAPQRTAAPLLGDTWGALFSSGCAPLQDLLQKHERLLKTAARCDRARKSDSSLHRESDFDSSAWQRHMDVFFLVKKHACLHYHQTLKTYSTYCVLYIVYGIVEYIVFNNMMHIRQISKQILFWYLINR